MPRLQSTLEAIGLGIVIAFCGAMSIGVNAAYHTGWREFAGKALSTAAVSNAAWLGVAAISLAAKWPRTGAGFRVLFALHSALLAVNIIALAAR
jgi:hypothetical protein